MIPIEQFPKINASLNALSLLFLLSGFVMIRRGRVSRHRFCMVAAALCSVVFLGFYLWYHAHAGRVHFQTPGPIRTLYLGILLSHTILAVAIVPLAGLTLWRALKGAFPKHKRIARVTWPLWVYVSLTGVTIYFFLYHLDPALTPR